jgi:hypothetical protein
MTARAQRPSGQEEPEPVGPLKVRIQIFTVGGAEGVALRATQAKVIRELLLWADDEQHARQSPDTR